MDESAPIRAIVIGVSTLLAVATISAVLMYYNSAKQLASNVGRGQDLLQIMNKVFKIFWFLNRKCYWKFIYYGCRC